MSITKDEVNLDKNQQGYSDLAARYLLLFAVAICSDSACYFLAFGFSSHSGLRYFVMAVDYTVNISCVYLQFSFANKQYQRYCGCMDALFRRQITKRTRTSIHRQITSRRRTQIELEVQQSISQQSTRTSIHRQITSRRRT